MAYTDNNIIDVVKTLRGSNAIEPVICKNADGSYSATSRLNVTDEEILCDIEDLENWCDKQVDEITDEDCAEFAGSLVE